MQIGQLVLVQTDPATQFVDAIAQNALAELDLSMPSGSQQGGPGFVDGGLAAGGAVRSRVKSIVIASVENLDWVVWLFADKNYGNANPANVNLCGYAALPASSAKRIGNTGLYYYFLAGLDLPYVDLGKLGQIHLGLQPTSAGKSAGAPGSVRVQLWAEPALGW